MRFKQFLLEMPTLNSISTREDSEFRELLNSNRYAFRSPNKVIEYNNLFLGLYTSRKELEIVAYKSKNINNGNAIAMCGGNFTNKFNFLSIDYSETLDSYKNKGIMSSIYTYIIETYGGIISDDSISVGISKIYEKLIKKFYSYSIDMFHKNLKPIKTLEMEKSKLIVLSKEELDIKEWDSIEESYFQQLLEMPKINTNKMTPSTSFKREDGKTIVKKDGIELIETSEQNYSLQFTIDNKIVGVMTIQEDDNIKGFVFISYVKVHSSYRGKGIASKMYDFAINHFGGIVSGMSLTKDEETKQGSFYVWKSLSTKYKIYSLEDEVLSKVDNIEDEKYKKVNVMFVSSKKKLTKKDVWGHVTLKEDE